MATCSCCEMRVWWARVACECCRGCAFIRLRWLLKCPLYLIRRQPRLCISTSRHKHSLPVPVHNAPLCSELSLVDAAGTFRKVAAAAAAAPTAAAQPRPSRDTHAVTALEADGSDSSRPAALSPAQRQSTFMRAVTHQLMQRLGADAQVCNGGVAGTSVMAEAGAASDTAHMTNSNSSRQVRASNSSCDSTSTEPCLEGGGDSNSADASRPYSCSSSTSSHSSSLSSNTSTDSSSTQGRMASLHHAAGDMQGSAAALQQSVPGGAAVCQPGSAVLAFSQFQQAMVLLSRRCFPRIANGSRAWKLLLERHVQPLADRKCSR